MHTNAVLRDIYSGRSLKKILEGEVGERKKGKKGWGEKGRKKREIAEKKGNYPYFVSLFDIGPYDH